MKRGRGRPESRIIKLDATPEEIAAAIFANADTCKPLENGVYKEVADGMGFEPTAGGVPVKDACYRVLNPAL